jgi:hypothetical protein
MVSSDFVNCCLQCFKFAVVALGYLAESLFCGWPVAVDSDCRTESAFPAVYCVVGAAVVDGCCGWCVLVGFGLGYLWGMGRDIGWILWVLV